MLLSAVYGESRGEAEVLVAHYETNPINGRSELKFDEVRWFTMPDQFEDAEKFIAENADKDVYFTPTLYSRRQRKAQYATVSNVVYMDADACHPDKFRITPTFSVETSPNRFQCYWMLDREHTSQEVSEMAHRMAVAHKDDGCDPSSWIMTKILRAPGTMHRKDAENPYDVVMADVGGEVFSLKEIDRVYSDVTVEKMVTVADLPMPDPDSLPRASDIVSNIPDELSHIFIDGAPDPTKRSETRMRFQIDLLTMGFTPAWVFAACQKANGLEKFTDEGRPEQLWLEVLKSVEYVERSKSDMESREESGDDVADSEIETLPVIEFISDGERDFIESNPGFIQEYTAWAKSRSPLSAETFHRTLSIILLSCVYGRWAYIVPKHGVMGLNMWGIIAGDTTATRKSTSRALMRSVLRQWQKVSGLTIDIGSDFTPQALVKTLGERDGLVSFVHRDEFQGFIHEIYTQNYMSGAAERLTELYDGKVMAVLRNTKELATEKEADTVFNFLAMGITKEIAGRMTSSNFRSGFLPRFVWSVAEPPEWEPSHEMVDQMDEGEEFTGKGDDPTVAHFIRDFRLAQRNWDSSKPRAIRFCPEALVRWNEWKVQTKEYIRGRQNEDIMEPARDRMSYTVWKTAALLAIHDRKTEISEEHLVRALEQAEWWFRDMMIMADQVASSDFESKVDAIELMLAAAGGSMPMKKVYAHKDFKKFRKGEVDECINSLEAQGRASRVPINNEMVLEIRRSS